MSDPRPTPPPRPALGHGGDLVKLFEGPAEASLNESQRAQVQQTRDVFRELEKLLKNTSLYGAGHESTGRFRERFFHAMSQGLQSGPLDIVVGPYTFSVHEQVVYENPNPEKNFVYKFYVDGIRRFTFQAGLRAAELDDFIDVLLIDWDDPALFEDDAVTMLWSKDFENIEYGVVRTFDEDTQEHEEFHFTIAGVVGEVRKTARSTAQTAQGRAARKGRPPVSPVVELTDDNLERLQASDFAMDEVEFRTLRGLLGANARETLEKFIEILFRVRLNETDPDQVRRIDVLFDRIAQLLLDRGRLGELERLMRKVLTLRGPDGLPDRRANIEAIGHIFERWTQAPFIEQLLATADQPDFEFLPSLQAICALLVPAAAVVLARSFGKVRAPALRQVLFAQLPSLIRGREGDVAHLLTDCDAAHGHSLLKAIGNAGNEDARGRAAEYAMKNPDASVRFEGLGSLQGGDVLHHLALLFSALEDDAKKVRSKAIHTLARIRSPVVHERLMSQIQEKGFSHYSLDEKRRYYAAAALSGEADPHFMEVLESSSGLLSRKHHDEERHCAAVALALRMNRLAIPLFQNEIRRRIRSEVVHQACRWALQHIARDRETRTRQLYDIFFRGELTGLEGEHG
ncbi:MAG: HEAT repeat domain-containing protein [Myxococcales bacterium]|nr:HEAT repeat domain-containing protein [Myxococcales bacterium]